MAITSTTLLFSLTEGRPGLTQAASSKKNVLKEISAFIDGFFQSCQLEDCEVFQLLQALD